MRPATIARLKRETGINYVVTCYDIIPIRHPDFYTADEVAGFCAYWRAILPIADRVLAISHHTLDDLSAWAAEEGLTTPPAEVVRLGSMAARPTGNVREPGLPAGVRPGRYVLMVGTIEPRKGHRLLIDVWQRLLREGLPQRHDFLLVFAGRYGWKMEEALADIARLSGEGRLLHLPDVSDTQLEALYRAAAFCVLPSVTEGFGLPIVEAFSHGKAIIVSTGGALPEVAGDLSPCVDLADTASWRSLIASWIAQPALRQPYEERIKESFRRPEWRAVAHDFWNAAARTAAEARCGPELPISAE